MRRIVCPWCETRDEIEFSSGQDGASGALAKPVGEIWRRKRHLHGCGQWFAVLLDPVTGKSLKAARSAPALRKAAPAADGAAEEAPSDKGGA